MLFIDADLIRLSSFDIHQLGRFMQGYSVVAAMNVRREIQRGITSYVKRHKNDGVAENLIWTCQQIENWCRKRYMKEMMPKVMMTVPQCTKSREMTKFRCKQEWERWVKEKSY